MEYNVSKIKLIYSVISRKYSYVFQIFYFMYIYREVLSHFEKRVIAKYAVCNEHTCMSPNRFYVIIQIGNFS